MGLDFTPSAAKHGFSKEDAVNAMLHYVDKVEAFDEPRMTGHARPDLYVGPALSGVLIEVMVEKRAPASITIFHCMRARRKILNLVEELGNR